ncbi:hypothetical protein Hte_005816 [Hypoxylon texense]
MAGLAQLYREPASSKANTIKAEEKSNSTAPMMSRRRSEDLDILVRKLIRTVELSRFGNAAHFKRKTHRQDEWSLIAPPSIGPRTEDKTVTRAMTAM